MTPATLSFPAHFERFRDVQVDAFEFALTSEKQFISIGAPTGCGKAGIAYGLSKLWGGRTVVLTAQRGLQDQYSREGFRDLVDMRGRSNFRCWEGGTCEDGARLGCKDHEGCPYRAKLKAFNAASFGVTNYAWWMAVFEKGTGCALPDTLICDEAHLAESWLTRSLDFHIGERECREAGLSLSPLPGEDIDVWIDRTVEIQCIADIAYEKAKAACLIEARHLEKARLAVKRAEGFVDRAKKMSRLDLENWVCTREEGTDDGRIWRFECIWPYRYKERLFQGIPRIVLMSATLRPKTLSLLGVKAQDYDFKEWPRQFPAANGPVVWVPTARVTHRWSEEDRQSWLSRINQIIEWGGDRKGLIHTVSYARAKDIAAGVVALSYNIILNGAADPDSATARQSYERFLKAGPGAVLVSPSFSTGWDFRGSAAEWQIVAKIPFPDTRSKVMQARCADDRGYSNYLAAQELVQSCGRIVRSETDRGMTLLIDNSWEWFKGIASEHMPRWFKVRREECLPKPLEKL